MAHRATGAGSAGTGTTAVPTVPAGLQVDDIVVLALYIQNTDVITWPTGFTQKQDNNTNASTRGRTVTAWKRITVADDATDEPDGEYDITWTNSSVFAAVAGAFSGRVKIGDPFGAVQTAQSSGANDLTISATLTTITDSDDIVCFGGIHSTDGDFTTAPSGMTERYPNSGVAGQHLALYTQDNAGVAGAYAKTTTWTGVAGSSTPKITLSGLMADRVQVRDSAATTGNAGTALTVTLPTHKTNDLLLICVGGKYGGTASEPTVSAGWTVIKALSGGTGSPGANTGLTFEFWIAKIATSAAESNPVVTPGGTAPNTWHAQSYSLVPATGMTFRDAIGSNVAWIEPIDDTDATSAVYAGTSSAFAGQPTTGDLILVVASGQNDSPGSISGTPTITATGKTNGSVLNVRYSETAAGDNAHLASTSAVGFTGPLSSGVTISINMGAGTSAGVIGVVAIRQTVPTTDLSVAAIAPLPVVAFALDVDTDVDLTIAATAPLPVVTIVIETDVNLHITAIAPLPVVAISIENVIVEIAVGAVAPLPVVAFALDVEPPDVDLTIDVTAPLPIVAFGLSAAIVTIDVTAIAPLPVIAIVLDSGIDEAPPVETDSDVVDDSEVDQEAHEEEWHSDVAVVEPAEPLPVAYDVLSAYTSISLSGTQPVVVGAVEVRKPRLRDRLLVDGVDVTFYNGVRTPTPDFSLIEPFTYGVCTLRFPQIFPLIQVLSAITWLRRGAPVLIQRVDEEGNVVATDYRGRIMGWDTTGDFMVSVGGMFSGPASVRFRPMPMVRRIEDVGYWLMTAFRHQRQPLVYDDFGVGLISRGENYYLDHCLELCSLGVKQNGSQITVHYDEDLMKWVAEPKDTTTIDATVYFDAGHMNPALTRDFTVETDEVFATAHLSDGTQILNSVWPGMQQEDPIPTYPGVLEEGDNNEDVSVLIARLVLLGYLKYVDRVGGFDDDVVDAILSARADAEQLGSANDEALDEDLWDWLWDLGAVGYTDKEARILPMAQRRKVRQWNRSATGNRIGINSFYDPVYASLTVSQKLELGHVKSKNHAMRLARTLLDDGSDNWVGTLSTVMSFVRGEHTPGDPITEADLMSGRELRPGMNLWAPLFQGGTLFRVPSIDISNDGNDWSLALDTRSRDTMQIDGILERNRENRTSPARAFWNARSSSSASDTIFNHDEHFGILGKNIDLPADEWLVYPVAAGDFGTVSQTTMRTIDAPAEFAMMVFQKKVTADWLTARVANPLNSDDEWWADESVRADFKSRGIKYAAGSEEDPCGYFPGRKSQGHALTGRWEDEASFAYGGDSLVFWVAVYADRISKLKRGDQFAVQRELGT